MDPSQTEPMAVASQPIEELWSAVRLWLWYQALWGAYWLLMGLGERRDEVLVIGHAITGLTSYVLIGWAAWNNRTACRIFAQPRRGMVELCIVVGVAGAMLLAMLESRIRGWSISPIAWEKDLGWPVGVCMVTVSLLPAVFEELLFRGLLLQRLSGVLSMPRAIAVQAMLFALLHIDGAYLLPHFAFGCLAGFLRTAAQALWPCMLLHGVWNGWLVLAEFGWL